MSAPPRPASSQRARLDALLVERGLVESRSRAHALVMAGAVRVDGRPAEKPAQLVHADASLDLDARDEFVSRGGHKLNHALDRFQIDVNGLVCGDVGASTGGFTDCLLRRGAQRVYAIDVGRGQLDWRLRNDPRVVVMERTNIRYVETLPEPLDFASVDVSFISLRLVLPVVVRLLRPGATLVALVKPQFEAGRRQVGRGGVIRDPEVHRRILEDLWSWCEQQGLTVRGVTASPIRGPAGNVEFLMALCPAASDEDGLRCASMRSDRIEAALAEAPTGGAGAGNGDSQAAER